MTEQEIRIANATSRTNGASAKNKDGSLRAVVPRYVMENIDKNKSILDFGAGKNAIHTLWLRDMGFSNVTAYDFGNNVKDELHDKNALNRKYDVVMMSNVINVQSSYKMLKETLNQVKDVLKINGMLIANIPASPRKLDIPINKYIELIEDVFNEKIVIIKGGMTSPLFAIINSTHSYNYKHGESSGENKTRLYRIWLQMKNRCNNPNSHKYKNYGARGITVCNEWSDSYESFRDWALNNGYQDDLSIDRIDMDGNYEPNNCKWSDNFEQANNKTTNIRYAYNGEIHTIAEWARISGINERQLNRRLRKYHWTIEKALTTPVKEQKYYEYNGETHTIPEWAKLLGVTKVCIYDRINNMGWSFEKAITTPPMTKH